MRIFTNAITGWGIATKTKPIKAKPLVSLLVDRAVTSKFFVDTLEGTEPVGEGAVICLGTNRDAWQQTPQKLLEKYFVVGIDSDGWMECEPRPGNAVNCIQITQEYLSSNPPSVQPPREDDDSDKAHDFYIIGLWGEVTVFGKSTQWGDVGDYVCQSQTDPNDVWIVKKKIFENTYLIK